MTDVIVVGGGVMGCSVALRLAKGGMSVVVLERSVPGAEASSAAAGILAPGFESVHGPRSASAAELGTTLSLGVRSRELHAALAEELRADHGIDVGFRRCGVMSVALSEEEVAGLDAHVRVLADHSSAPIAMERMDGDEARRREPALNVSTCAALELPDEAQLEPRILLRALALAAERAGAVFRTGAPVEAILPGAPAAVIVGGERLEADHVVVAAGSWTSLLPGLELAADTIHPVRGQMIATETRPPLFRRVLFGAGGYVVTRPDGRVLCGSTEERVGFRRGVTLGGLRDITEMAIRLAPRLANAELLDQWSSFRPGTADELPLVGPAGPRGISLASGHFRNGILLAPVTAEIVRAGILGEHDPHAKLVDPRRMRT